MHPTGGYGSGFSRSGGSPYGSGGGSPYSSGYGSGFSGSRYERLTPAGARRVDPPRRRPRSSSKDRKGASPWGFIGNLASDVTDAVVGIGTVPVTLAREQWRDISQFAV
ncbi:MAG: hypothetical protein WD942_07175 [Dehalococcoidia bacterium]